MLITHLPINIKTQGRGGAWGGDQYPLIGTFLYDFPELVNKQAQT